MSYCRNNGTDSDVYVIGTRIVERAVNGEDMYRDVLMCYCVSPSFYVIDAHPEQMILHLAEHKNKGHMVPIRAIVRLWNEIPITEQVQLTLDAALQELNTPNNN